MNLVKKQFSIIPNLRFPEFKDEWQERRLGDLISEILSGGSPSQFNLNETKGTPFIKVDDLNNNDKYQISSRNYVEDNIKSTIPIGSVVFPKRGAAIMTNKVRINKVNILIDSNLMAITPKSNQMDGNFLYYLISKEGLYKIADTSTIPQINNKHIKPYKVIIPSIDEQKRISSLLTEVDELNHALKSKLEYIRTYKKSLTQNIFNRKVRFKDDKGNYFPDWIDRKLSDVMFEHKLKSSGCEEVYSVSVHKGVINQKDHLGRSYASIYQNNYNLVRPEDVIYTKSPTSNFPWGIIKQSRIDKNVIVSPLYGVFTPETPGLGYMLHVYFESPINTRNYLNSIVRKGAKNTINITNKIFLSKAIKLPVSKEEQNKIGNILKIMDTYIDSLCIKIDLIEQWKKGLIQHLFI